MPLPLMVIIGTRWLVFLFVLNFEFQIFMKRWYHVFEIFGTLKTILSSSRVIASTKVAWCNNVAVSFPPPVRSGLFLIFLSRLLHTTSNHGVWLSAMAMEWCCSQVNKHFYDFYTVCDLYMFLFEFSRWLLKVIVMLVMCFIIPYLCHCYSFKDSWCVILLFYSLVSDK